MKALLVLALLCGCSNCAIVKNDVGEAIGYAELAGLRYPVKHYSAWVAPEFLMRGSRIDKPEGYQYLKDKGFGVIIDLRAEGQGDSGYKAGEYLKVVRIPIIDNTVPSMEDVTTFLLAVRDAKAQGTKVYFHCEAGVGRTGVMAAAYRVYEQGWTSQDALTEARKYGLGLPDQEAFILSFNKK